MATPYPIRNFLGSSADKPSSSTGTFDQSPSSTGMLTQAPRQGSKRGRTSSDHRPSKHELRRAGAYRQMGRRTESQERVIDEFEASVARTIVARSGGRVRGRGTPDMNSWAAALGVDIEASKVTERDRRRVEMEEAGQKRPPGGWRAPAAPTRGVASTSSLGRGRDRDYAAQQQQQQRQRHSYASGRRKHYSPPGREARRGQVPEVVALDEFLSDLHGRLTSLEGEAEATDEVMARGSATSFPGHIRASDDTLGFDGGGSVLSGAVDAYGVPRSLVASAEQVRGGAKTSEGALYLVSLVLCR